MNNKLTGLLFTVVIVFTALAVFSSLYQSNAVGITVIEGIHSNRLIVALQDRFVVVNASGRIKGEYFYRDAGLEGPVRDIQQLRNAQYLIGDGGSQSLFICSEHFFNCRSLGNEFASRQYPVGRFHKFVIDFRNNQILLSNTEKHELVRLDMDGNLLSIIASKETGLKFPDDIYQLDDKQLLVANSKGREILLLEESAGKAVKKESFSIKSSYTTNAHELPMTLSTDSYGDWWVTAQPNTASGTGSSLLQFNSEWQAIGRIDDTQLVSPVDTYISSGVIYIADAANNRIYTYSLETRQLSWFGDNKLIDLFDSQNNLKEMSIAVKYISIGIVLIALLLVMFLENKRKKLENKNADVESEFSTINIEFSLAAQSAMRILPIVMLVTLVISGFLLKGSMTELVMVVYPAFFSMIITMMIFFQIMIRQIPRNIEVVANKITILDYRDNSHLDTVGNITYSDQAIKLQDKYFLLGNHGALMKNRAQYQQLMNLLEAGTQISSVKMQVDMFKVNLKWNLLAIVLLVSSIIYVYIFLANVKDASQESAVVPEQNLIEKPFF